MISLSHCSSIDQDFAEKQCLFRREVNVFLCSVFGSGKVLRAPEYGSRVQFDSLQTNTEQRKLSIEVRKSTPEFTVALLTVFASKSRYKDDSWKSARFVT